jgi:hypothetical protein
MLQINFIWAVKGCPPVCFAYMHNICRDISAYIFQNIQINKYYVRQIVNSMESRVSDDTIKNKEKLGLSCAKLRSR